MRSARVVSIVIRMMFGYAAAVATGVEVRIGRFAGASGLGALGWF
jgi:hypothetical protein